LSFLFFLKKLSTVTFNIYFLAVLIFSVREREIYTFN